MSQLWEILVPCVVDGHKVSVRQHRKWDEEVRQISKGLTILTPVKGQWIDKNNLVAEEVIPVRIACSLFQIKKIARLTAVHYKQKAVMYYQISQKVFIDSFESLLQKD